MCYRFASAIANDAHANDNDMDLLKRTNELCKQYNIKPSRTKGQNFLITEDIYNKIIESADLKKDDIILEVGPGLGFLTEKLAKNVKKVIAVELDDKLAEALRGRLGKQRIENVKVINENVLDFRIRNSSKSAGRQESGISGNNKIPNSLFIIPDSRYKVVANLPYNITSIFLRKVLSLENKPEVMVLMLQKEVAGRITAKPGKLSLLAVSVQFYAEAEIIEYVSKDNFWPKPEVDSAIVKLEVRSNLPAPPKADRRQAGKLEDDERKFFQMVKFGFSARRKMLKNNLAGGYHITQEKVEKLLKLAGFDQKIRAQELSIQDWVNLFEVLEKNML